MHSLRHLRISGVIAVKVNQAKANSVFHFEVTERMKLLLPLGELRQIIGRSLALDGS